MFTIAMIGQKGGRGKTTAGIGLAVEAARNGAELVIIDTPGKSTNVLVKACRAANLVLISAKDQIFESETLDAVRDILRLAGDPIVGAES